eukprot:7330060-Prymnesium_polylepis.1
MIDLDASNNTLLASPVQASAGADSLVSSSPLADALFPRIRPVCGNHSAVHISRTTPASQTQRFRASSPRTSHCIGSPEEL